jgi:flagellar hook-associated protein 1 FlgK
MSSALNNALTGLTANARMAEVVSSNLSNALTDGYGKRTVSLSSVQVGDMGGGVRVDAINRFVDAGILADRRLADASLNGQERSAGMLMRLQEALGGPDNASGIVSRLAEFERALISASSDPASETRLANVVSRLQDVTATLQQNTKSVQSLRQEADASIGRDVGVINRALLQVEQLNGDILRISGSGNDTSSLLDARQRAVDQIAELLPVREIPRENGTIGLMTTNGFTLLDSKAVTLSFVRTPTITADMTIGSGALGGIAVDGVPVDPANGIGRLEGGALGAAFAMRDGTLVDAQAGLDNLAADLIARFQDATNDPSLTPGDIGLLTDEGGVLDLSDIPGLAGRIDVNPAVVPALGGALNLIRDGLNAAVAGPAGDTQQLNRWIAALSDSRADVPGSAAQSLAGRASDFTSEVGATRLISEEKLSFTMARWESLREAELADGVDTDQELQKLLRVEQSYAANAKVIQTVDFMMQRLLEI